MMCKQESKGIPLSAEQDKWFQDTYEEPDKQELEAHYMYMAKIHEVIHAIDDNSGPTYDDEPLEKVHTDDNYNMFTNERQHSEQPESINNTYVAETVDSNIIIDSMDMCDNEKRMNKMLKNLRMNAISTYIDSRLENIDRFLNGSTQQPNEIHVDDLEPDDKSVDTPLVSPFLDSDDDFDDGEVLNELEEYGNAGQLCLQRAINSFDGDHLEFQYMISFRKFVTYFDPFFLMNIITRKAYNTIMVKGLKSIWKNLVAIVRDVYVFIRSFTYIMDFVIFEDIGELILRDMAEVVMGKPFRKVTKLEYDCAKGLMSFTRIFNNYTFQIPRTIPRFKN
nr:MAK10-like protein [Tanacetum cinerariifolium]